MLFKRFVGCIYRSLREMCTTPQCAVLLVSRWTGNTHTFAICSNERKLEHSTQLMTMTMTYGPKKYNPLNCVAPRRKLTMACGRITNFPSCVARRPRRLLSHFIMNCDRMTDFPSCLAQRLLCHFILKCDLNTMLSSYEAHICVEHLHQIRGDHKRSNTTEALFSQVSRGAEGFFCITKANHVVHTVLFRFRSTIAADLIMLVRVMKEISVV